jgi:hypothetical protein
MESETSKSPEKIGTKTPIGLAVQNFLGSAAQLVFGIYFFIAVMIFAPYYNWIYARDNGFVKWVLLGQIVPTVQSFGWPYYTFFRSNKEADLQAATAKAFSESLTYWSAAAQLFTKSSKNPTLTDAMAARALIDNALEKAQGVDVAALNRHYENLGNRFRDQYIFGLSKIQESLRNRYSEQDFKIGRDSVAEFAAWFEPRMKEIFR